MGGVGVVGAVESVSRELTGRGSNSVGLVGIGVVRFPSVD